MAPAQCPFYISAATTAATRLEPDQINLGPPARRTHTAAPPSGVLLVACDQQQVTMTTTVTTTTTACVAAIIEMIETGVFGQEGRFVSFTLDGQHTDQDQFASSILYGTVIVADRDCRQQSHRLVFKFKHPIPEIRALIQNDKQFHNEILFYERIAPFLLARCSRTDADEPATPSICRFFYGRNDCGDQVQRDMIVLENESTRGYRSANIEHRLCLDYDHLVVALRALAK